jgi:arginase
MRVRLLHVPYDSGHRGARMGAGPLALAEAGAARTLRDQGHEVHERFVEAGPWRTEIATAAELQRLVAVEAAAARDAGEMPLMLSGNCNTTLGLLTGRVGVVWLDAHGDFNTPDTTVGGFLDGQGLAMVVGRCWTGLTATVPGFRPVPEDRVVLIGARSLDAAEEAALRASAVTWLTPDRVPGGLGPAVDALAAQVDGVHVHIDLDVHDPSIAPANEYAAPDGLTAGQVHDVVRQVAGRIPIVSATLASYDPSYDPRGAMRDTALSLLTLLAGVRQVTSPI